ncbi:hypothetical protein [Aerosakkonema funiforme]|uniref:hypothetical protein n=1 Tax=Aerosakkonema funiforme TaxID=1246630 RepID=UPI0035B76A68
MSIETSTNVYGDEIVTATELNRQPERILDIALEHPVTINHNDRYFALLPREQMAFWVKATNVSKTVFELINIAYRLRLGEQIDPNHTYEWLKVFDAEELSQLIAEVETEFRQIGLETGAIDKLDAVIHEWYESALANSSPELAIAFIDEVDEVLLTQPAAFKTTESFGLIVENVCICYR